METQGSMLICPVCSLYLREGLIMRDHLNSHTKSIIITTLLMATRQRYPDTRDIGISSHSPIPVEDDGNIDESDGDSPIMIEDDDTSVPYNSSTENFVNRSRSSSSTAEFSSAVIRVQNNQVLLSTPIYNSANSGRAIEDVVSSPVSDDPPSSETEVIMDFIDTNEEIYNGANSGRAIEDVVSSPVSDDPPSSETEVIMDFVDTNEETYDGANLGRGDVVLLQLAIHDHSYLPGETIYEQDIVEEIVTFDALDEMTDIEEYLR